MLPSATRSFEDHRGMLGAIAYRILGSWTDAEDVVQDAWLRWSRVAHDQVDNPRGFLVRTVTRLAIDRLRRRQARREEYHGEWLPEPIATDVGPEEGAIMADSLSTALLLILETLSPLERAVYVLREAFGYSYAEVAEMVGRREEAVRQLALRARRHVQAERPRYQVTDAQRRAATERFLAASASGDVRRLMEVLSPDVTLVADSGGKVRAPLLPVGGADKVSRFLVAALARVPPGGHARVARLNGAWGVLATDGDQVVSAATLDVDTAGRVVAIYLMGNPDKLRAVRGT